MAHIVSVQSHIFSKDEILSQRTEFKLPLTEISNLDSTLHPCTFNFCIAENYHEIIDLQAIGGKLRLLAVKSTRPVEVVLTYLDDTESVSPKLTYYQLLFNSQEVEFIPLVKSITFNVVPASVVNPAPVPLPPTYPRAIIEVFALLEDIVPHSP
jgi:hypothetical protein